MLSNLSENLRESIVNYPIFDGNLPFSEYIAHTRNLIEERRQDLTSASKIASAIIDANSPYELIPTKPILLNNKSKYGVLLIHGLLDCPFSLKDIARHLQSQGMLCRSILLPGHGTTPSDLLSVSYHDWIQAVRYGVDSLKKEVDQVYLIGYSTGATLSIYQALQDSQIAGLILLAPAIRIKAPVDMVVGWHYLMKWLHDNRQWIYSMDEVDYTKYLSIAFNPVSQVAQLTDIIRDLRRHHPLTCPVFMAVSREDETISSDRAIHFFSSLSNQENKLLLYTSCMRNYSDPRIITRSAIYPDLNIKHMSHSALPFAPTNSHYGQHGDYSYASKITNTNYTYGAYNRLEMKTLNLLNDLKVIGKRHRMLTYNPDFDYLAEQITQFILN